MFFSAAGFKPMTCVHVNHTSHIVLLPLEKHWESLHKNSPCVHKAVQDIIVVSIKWTLFVHFTAVLYNIKHLSFNFYKGKQSLHPTFI